jgi:hypothetical protein
MRTMTRLRLTLTEKMMALTGVMEKTDLSTLIPSQYEFVKNEKNNQTRGNQQEWETLNVSVQPLSIYFSH